MISKEKSELIRPNPGPTLLRQESVHPKDSSNVSPKDDNIRALIAIISTYTKRNANILDTRS